MLYMTINAVRLVVYPYNLKLSIKRLYFFFSIFSGKGFSIVFQIGGAYGKRKTGVCEYGPQ